MTLAQASTVDLVSLSSPEMQRDPFPTYAKLRQLPTIPTLNRNVTGPKTYFVTRYDQVLSILKDPIYANDGRKIPDRDDWSKKWYIPSVMKAFADTMVLVDEPDHARLRGLVHKAFTPSMIGELAGNIEDWTNRLLDNAAKKPVCDFIADFALPLPLNIVSDMLGVALPDRASFSRWMKNNISDINMRDPIGMATKMVNAFRLNGFLKRLINDRRVHPGSDLTTALVQAESAGDKLSEVELNAMIFLLLFAGHETTVNLLGSGILALLRQPDQLEKLKTEPSLIDSAVEELLRFTSPTQHIAVRYPLEDVVIGSTTVPKYSSVLLGIAAANRDETIFPNPEQIDLSRTPNKHIAFGFGIHYCVGAPLARLEAKIAFTILLKRFPNLTLATTADQLAWHGAPALRGLNALPMRLNG